MKINDTAGISATCCPLNSLLSHPFVVCFSGGMGRKSLNIIVKWLYKKSIRDQYPGIIYTHVRSRILTKAESKKINK